MAEYRFCKPKVASSTLVAGFKTLLVWSHKNNLLVTTKIKLEKNKNSSSFSQKQGVKQNKPVYSDERIIGRINCFYIISMIYRYIDLDLNLIVLNFRACSSVD